MKENHISTRNQKLRSGGNIVSKIVVVTHVQLLPPSYLCYKMWWQITIIMYIWYICIIFSILFWFGTLHIKCNICFNKLFKTNYLCMYMDFSNVSNVILIYCLLLCCFFYKFHLKLTFSKEWTYCSILCPVTSTSLIWILY